MHYANGRAAKIGDLVRGRGYNLKHEFTGLLVSATPAASACNCQVATVTPQSAVCPQFYRWSKTEAAQPLLAAGEQQLVRSVVIFAQLEYGQLDAFVALDPATGEVLPPEEETAS